MIIFYLMCALIFWLAGPLFGSFFRGNWPLFILVCLVVSQGQLNSAQFGFYYVPQTSILFLLFIGSCLDGGYVPSVGINIG